MGDVYRAHDRKLGRDVALKFLPKEFALDPERLVRFRREARTLALLNHPNIAAIYGLEESNETICLVLELVEGETLRAPQPIEKALEYMRQVAEALEAAHERGIIHRDIKPANIKLTPEGRIKVLDFGLAKAILAADAPIELSPLEKTLTQMETLVGRIVGTPQYMSPEQSRGETVDQRTDIWAFGCVLFELLVGKPPFEGEALQDIITNVRNRHPAWKSLPAKTPAKIRELLRQCLEKGMERRLPSISAARQTMERVQHRRNYSAIAAGIIGVLTLGAIAGLYIKRQPTMIDPSKWVQLTNFPDSVTQPAFSPDGRMLTFVRGFSTFAAPGEIYVKALPSGQPAQLTADNLPKMSPVFSPDGSRIAYTALRGSSWDTWIAPVSTGRPTHWLTNASGLRWTGQDRLMFSQIKSGEHMAIVSATESRGESRDIYVPAHDRGMAHRSYLSPEQPDRKFVYLSVVTGMQSAGAFGRTYVIPLVSGKLFPLIPPDGFHSEAEIAKLPGVRVIEGADVFPGSTPETYAYSRQTVQRNLYQIPLP